MWTGLWIPITFFTKFNRDYRVPCEKIRRVVNITEFVFSNIGDTFFMYFWQYSISILLFSGALVKSVNNNITVTERVKTMTVVFHLK